jgi:TDG/mug DNA glycosylase family protein
VLPNPSGLNAHESVDSLAAWYRQAAEAAGVPLHRPLRA